MLLDSYARQHTNLRISVTDRCNIRCYYCMPEDVRFGAREDILSFEEMERVVRVAASLGVDKIRITGGEPLVRKDLHLLVKMLSDMPLLGYQEQYADEALNRAIPFVEVCT